MSEPSESEKQRKEPRPNRPPETERTVPLGALTASLRKLLEGTPRKEWYRIKAVRATYQETNELVVIANALEYLLKVTPEKILRRVTDEGLEERAFYGAYREVRDRISALRDKCLDLGSLAGVKVKAWSDGRGKKRSRGGRPGSGSPRDKPEKATNAA
jgi:hypothetical protein